MALSQVKKGQNSTTCKDSVQPASPVYEEIKGTAVMGVVRL